MADFSHFTLQGAIVNACAGDGELMAIVTGVYDRPPQGTLFPYITLGEMTGSDWSTKTTTGMEYAIALHVWSREGGRKEAAAIMESLHALFHQANLTVDGQSLVMLRFVSSGISLESDGWTYHGVMQFHALLQADNQS
jgi:hypothetical protein